MAPSVNHLKAKEYLANINSLTLVQLADAMTYKWFRLNVLYHIKNKEGKKVLFEPNAEQESFYLGYHGRDIILKARQLGFTTFKMISDLDDCLFIPNHSAGCICHNLEDAKDIFRNKIKFAYQAITQSQRELLRSIGYELPKPVNDKDNSYVFTNGSSIKVSVSYRGGTLQSLHVSEFGKICKKFPDKAKEIVTGAFEAVGINGDITLESTAEGREGYFYDYCTDAKKIKDQNKEPSKLDFAFHFFPWHTNAGYSLEGGEITHALEDYFDGLEHKNGIALTDEQKAWYSAKWRTLGDDMKREYPSTPEEAFAQSIEGAYYAVQFRSIYADGRICKSLNNTAPVYTAWDIGVGDSTAIWFYQKIGNEIHLVDYYENSGESLEHYMGVLKRKGYQYKYHYAPHDIDNREFGSGGLSRVQIASNGFEIDGQRYRINFSVVPKKSIDAGIEDARRLLARCVFDEHKCAEGIKALESYRKEWNDKLGCWRDRPLHDWSSHCFTADTNVLTRTGTYRIIDLPSQGEVMTIWGWKKYLNPRKTRAGARLVLVEMSDGNTERCTPDHKWLTDKGWICAESLVAGSKILCTSTKSPNTLWASYTGFTQVKNILQLAVSGFIELFGKVHSEEYRKDITYTTETAIKQTTQSRILRFFMKKTTSVLSGARKQIRCAARINLGFLSKPKNQPQNGIARQKAENGIASKQLDLNHGRSGKESYQIAHGAEMSLVRLLEQMERLRSSVMPTVRLHTIEIRSVSKLDYVEDVYCITVPDAEHFSLANGAVVHNCADAFRYLATAEAGMAQMSKAPRAG